MLLRGIRGRVQRGIEAQGTLGDNVRPRGAAVAVVDVPAIAVIDADGTAELDDVADEESGSERPVSGVECVDGSVAVEVSGDDG